MYGIKRASPLFPRTVKSVQMKKTQESSIFIYGNTIRESGLWTDFWRVQIWNDCSQKPKKSYVRQAPSTKSCK